MFKSLLKAETMLSEKEFDIEFIKCKEMNIRLLENYYPEGTMKSLCQATLNTLDYTLDEDCFTCKVIKNEQ